jgi:release factor glutamine methyltransferase
LDVVRRVAAAAPEWLAPGGHLLIETGARQATIAAGILDRRGLETQVAHSPGQEATVVVGARP